MKLKLMALAVAQALFKPVEKVFFEGIPRFHIPAGAKFALLTTNSPVALGQNPMPEPKGSEVVSVRLEHSLAANPGANDTAWLADLPEDCVVVDCVLDAPDLDTNGAPTITISAGFLNAAKTDIVAPWIVASTLGQAGGIARPTISQLFREGSSSSRRGIGLKFPAVAATFAAGVVGLTVFYRAAHFGK
jgi:hypothetical protein